jgi:hypothetical protein
LGGRSVSVLHATHLGLFMFMVGMVAISARLMVVSISEGDAGSAWIWVALFGVACFIAAWFFWRVM